MKRFIFCIFMLLFLSTTTQAARKAITNNDVSTVRGRQVIVDNLNDNYTELYTIYTLLGVTVGDLSLGDFSGTTITSDGTTKEALQELETALELVSAGDVAGPATATDNALVRYDTTTGKLLQNSVVTVSDAGAMDMGGNLISSVTDPISAQDAATKEYVDTSISAFNIEYFFNDTASDIGGIYYDMTSNALGGAESTISTAGLTAATADQALINFATDEIGGLGILSIPEGTIGVHVHAARTAGNSATTIYGEIYKRAAGGTETLIATTETSSAVTTKGAVGIHAHSTTDTDLLATDRIVLKLFANCGAGSGATIALYQEGTTVAGMTFPTTSEVINQIFVRQDGTKPLTANWDVGSYGITATQFTSDIGIGTAPLVVTSTTVVTNLNADLLDGNEASAFEPVNAALVEKTGTPVDNQIAIWTADGIIEGDTDLTFDGTDLTTTGTMNIGVGLDAVGAVDMDYGSADVTDHTFITDSTGTAEIVLPAGAIDGTEILDDTIDSADYAADSIDEEHLNIANAATDEYVLSYEADTSNFQWKAAGAGDVVKTGTPVNDQVGIWTADGVIEGDVDLTFDGDNLTVDGTVTATGGLVAGAGTISQITGSDSNSLDADQGIYRIYSDATTVTAGAVVSDVTIAFKDGGDASGAYTDAIIIDGSDNQVEFQINTTLQAGDIAFAELSAGAKFQSYAVASLSDTTTPSVLTTEETTNKCISNYKASGADHVFTMPAAHAGGNVIFMIGDEFQVDIEPDTGDLFYLNGTAMAANEHIQNTADTLGESIVGYCANINGTLRWMFKSSDTAFVEETP